MIVVPYGRVVRGRVVKLVSVPSDEQADRAAPDLVLGPYRAPIAMVAFSADMQTVVVGTKDGALRLLDHGESRARVVLQGSAPLNGFSYYRAVAFSRDGSLVAVGEMSPNRAHLWNAASGEHLRAMASVSGPVSTLVFSPDARRLISATTASVWVWDVATGRLLAEHFTHTGGTLPTEVSPDGLWAASAEAHGGGLHVYQVWPWKRIRTLETVGKWLPYLSMRFSGDGTRLLLHGGNLWAQGYAVPAFERQYAWRMPTGDDLSDATVDAKVALTVDEQGVAVLWDVPSGREIRRLHRSEVDVWGHQLSPDGRHIMGKNGNVLHVWKVHQDELVKTVLPP